MSRYPWRDTSTDIAGGQPPQWETPQGAQTKADEALKEAKDYTDQQNTEFTEHIEDTTIHVTPADKVNWNSKAPGVHTHANATLTTPGFMSAEDKTKLNGIEEGANNYVHPVTHPPTIIAQDTGNRFVTDAEKVTWNGKAETTEATTSAKGLMSAGDKQKLNAIQTGAEVNQNAFSQVNDVVASDPSDVVTFVGGTGITVTTNPSTKQVTVTATGDATPGAHASSHITGGSDVIPNAVTDGASGLMSGTDAKFVRVDGESKAGAQAKAYAVREYVDGRLDTPERASITLQPGVHVVDANQDAAFKLAGLQGRTVLNYQSQIGIYGVLNPYVIRYGKNLLPPFYDGWQNTPRNDETGKGSVISSYNYSVVANEEESWIGSPWIPAIPGKTYTFSAEHNGQIHLVFTDKDKIAISGTGYATEQSATLIAPVNTVYVVAYFRNTGATAGTYFIKNPMLNIGSFALPFTSRQDSMLALQTELHANPDTGANPDSVFERDGQYYKLAKWKKLILNGELSYANYSTGSTNGFKRVRVLSYPAYNPSTWSPVGTKYNGTQLSRGNIEIADALYGSTDGSLLAINVSNADSGWGESYTPTADEIKAYFMGWKMFDASTNPDGSGLYNRTDDLNKAWCRRSNGIDGNSGYVDGTTILPTTKAISFTPYQLLYQLATPVVEPITSEGQLTLIEGDNQVEVGTGIVLRELAKPKINSVGDLYTINTSGGDAITALSNKVDKFIGVFRNSKIDMGWTENFFMPFGRVRKVIPTSNFDPSAAYSVIYLMLDKYPSVDITGTYAENEKALLLDTVKTLQENTTRISVLESKKAEKDSPAWIAPTLLNGWVNYGDGFTVCRYTKDSLGFVHFDGLIKNGTTTNTPIFKLPIGYRPNMSITCVSIGGDALARIRIDPTGDVIFVSGGNSYFSLVVPPFLAEK